MFWFLRRKKISALIWMYLDGVIPPDRFTLLEKLLRVDRWTRTQFVDCAVLNALLFAYFNPNRYAAVPSATGHPQTLLESEAGGLDLEAELRAIEQDEAHVTQPSKRRQKRPAG
ncbi:MAG: hypothetical protein AAGC44_03335 [Planctomycetota bacterium]